MNATAKIGLALLVVTFLSLNPIGACAGSMRAASPPEHPCCPTDQAPAPEECLKLGCVCINVKPPAFVVPANNDEGTLVTLPEGEVVLLSNPTTFGTAVIERIRFVQDHRFLTFRQILI